MTGERAESAESAQVRVARHQLADAQTRLLGRAARRRATAGRVRPGPGYESRPTPCWRNAATWSPGSPRPGRDARRRLRRPVQGVRPRPTPDRPPVPVPTPQPSPKPYKHNQPISVVAAACLPNDQPKESAALTKARNARRHAAAGVIRHDQTYWRQLAQRSFTRICCPEQEAAPPSRSPSQEPGLRAAGEDREPGPVRLPGSAGPSYFTRTARTPPAPASGSCVRRPAAPPQQGADRPHRGAVDPQRGVSTLWAAHDVRLHRTGIKHFQHPVVGALNLSFDALELPGEPGLTLTVYSADPAPRRRQPHPASQLGRHRCSYPRRLKPFAVTSPATSSNLAERSTNRRAARYRLRVIRPRFPSGPYAETSNTWLTSLASGSACATDVGASARGRDHPTLWPLSSLGLVESACPWPARSTRDCPGRSGAASRRCRPGGMRGAAGCRWWRRRPRPGRSRCLRGRPRPRLWVRMRPRTTISPPQTPQGSRRRIAPSRQAARIGQSRADRLGTGKDFGPLGEPEPRVVFAARDSDAVGHFRHVHLDVTMDGGDVSLTGDRAERSGKIQEGSRFGGGCGSGHCRTCAAVVLVPRDAGPRTDPGSRRARGLWRAGGVRQPAGRHAQCVPTVVGRTAAGAESARRRRVPFPTREAFGA